MSYPTQEDELRAKEAQSEDVKNEEETKFLSTFQSVPRKNSERLAEMANAAVSSFNRVMAESRLKPFARQEDVMAGMKKLFEEHINVIEARRTYTVRINPSTANEEKA